MVKYSCARCGKLVKKKNYKKYENPRTKEIEWLCTECFEKAMNEDIEIANQEIDIVNAEMENLRQKALEDEKLQAELEMAKSQEELAQLPMDKSKIYKGKLVQNGKD